MVVTCLGKAVSGLAVVAVALFVLLRTASDVMLMLMCLNMMVMVVLRVVERPVALLLEVLGSVVPIVVTTAAWHA